MAYNIRIIEELSRRAIKRHNIKAIENTEDGSRTLFYFDGKIYRQQAETIGRLIALEESRVYKEWKDGTEKTALHESIGYMVERPNDEKKAVDESYQRRVLGGEFMPLFMGVGEQTAAYKVAIPLAPAAKMGERTAGLLCLSDGLLRITADKVELLPHNPKPFFTSYLDIAYGVSKTYYNTELLEYENFVYAWANQNKQVERLIKQMLGAIIQQDAGSGKVFVITNEQGGNGKSTYTNSIISFIGIDNTSAISLQAMAKDSHQAAALVGKFCNVVDDMQGDYVGDVSILKTMVTGGYTVINPKHQKPYSARITATCIINCNKIPRIGDTSGGLADRMCVVPFLARFRDTADDIKDREMNVFFAKPQTRRAMLEIAIQGLQDVMQNGYVIPDIVKEVTEKYLRENTLEIDSVLAFIEDVEECSDKGMAEWSNHDVRMVYARYSKWCDDNNRKAKANNVFSKDFLLYRKQFYEVKPYRRKVANQRWCDASKKYVTEEITMRGKEFIAHTSAPLPIDTVSPQQLKISENRMAK